MAQNKAYLGLDVGEVRIGVALADDKVCIAIPYGVVQATDDVQRAIAKLVVDHDITTIVIGYPRNQSGEKTAQTNYVEEFAASIKDIADNIVFQDESLTSVMAEDRLRARQKDYQKEDIDAEAATIILQDYLELNR